MGSFGETHNIYTHNLLNILITSSSKFLPVMFFSVIRVFIRFYDENEEGRKIMAKEKTGRNFHLYENELNSLKKDTEMLAITK